MEATKELVKLGLGSASSRRGLREKKLRMAFARGVAAGPAQIATALGILQWRGKRLSLAEETFIGLCKSASAAFINIRPDHG